ncbi:radical SAM protein [Ruminiclostridium herbifermentans]|uniref:Radical SAM protein n=1 Tax=Ruminiclostridium herbifermentans TaxID=2488810 RepID=A0A4U7JGE6_9FIRM|nr:PqqD family peptide modification chaperone [Ruminiclostridium herbifermentans]QNU67040.1 radical SAM protein [Ruminiclostridium herbifermentans]
MVIELNKDVIIKKHNNIGLLINTEQARYRKLNSSGLVIAEFLQESPKMSRDELFAKLSNHYCIPKKLLVDDVNKFLDELIELGFLKDSSSEEKNIVPNDDFTGNGLWLKVTNRCNLKCVYCYANSGTFDSKSELSIEEIESLLSTMTEPIKKIIITGGEPLLRYDILDIIRLCNKYGKVQLLTNGTLGDAELYKNILQLVDSIQISIDSDISEYHDRNRGAGSFEKAVNNAKIISEIDNSKLAIAMTPTPKYKPDIVDMIKFCQSIGVYQLHINRFVPYGRAIKYEDDFDLQEFYNWVDKGYEYIYETYVSYYKQNRKFNFLLDVASDLNREVYSTNRKCSCGINHNLLSIDCNGDVYLCPSLHKKELILGNIKEKSLVDIKLDSKKRFKSFSVGDLDKCKDCELKYFCAGGCRAIALNNTNDLYGVENNCAVYKKRILDLMVR